ncbi:MAG: ATP-binding protein [Clostridia bacterium]|nr:ATP-binding protein [Clostridia bacterium]
MKVYAFVGPSGTGKSYRAQMVAGEKNIEFIIDDGLLVKDNEIIAGNSAKKAPTKIETVKHALFLSDEEKQEIHKALKKYKPESILILGTSDGMVEKIANNLGLPKIIETTYIQDVATEQEMETARRIRVTEGKHVIPVPTFELKKDFSGYLLDPLQIFKSKGKGQKPYISEKSIIRPTFSYMGKFTISDSVFRQIAEHIATKSPAIYKILKTRVENYEEGPTIYMEVMVVYGFNVIEELKKFKERAKKEIENLTSMNVISMEVVAKSAYVPEEED